MGEYLHGYSEEEQQRLWDQALFLEDMIYKGVDLSKATHLLELGSGVGGQTHLLLKKFPHLQITCVDVSADQIATAKKNLATEIKAGQVEFVESAGGDLSGLGDRQFDGTFLCWLLEHVPDPLAVLIEVKKYLKPGAVLYSTEVNNSSLFLEPYSPNLLKYWDEYNDYQWSIKGHPFVGLQMGNLLNQAKYKEIHVDNRSIHYDSRLPEERDKFFHHFMGLFWTAEEALTKEKRVNEEIINGMKEEIKAFDNDPYSVFMYQWTRSTATA